MLLDLLRGLGTSLEIFAFTLLIALPLGFPLALGRMSKNRLVSGAIGVWISIVRGTPLMLQIIFVYFAPYILFGMPLARYPRLLATVLAFSNDGDVELFVNGRSFGRKSPDDAKGVLWEGVRLRPGENEIEVVSTRFREFAHWRLHAASND